MVGIGAPIALGALVSSAVLAERRSDISFSYNTKNPYEPLVTGGELQNYERPIAEEANEQFEKRLEELHQELGPSQSIEDRLERDPKSKNGNMSTVKIDYTTYSEK